MQKDNKAEKLFKNISCRSMEVQTVVSFQINPVSKADFTNKGH